MSKGLSLFETVVGWLRLPADERRSPVWIELRARGAGRDLIRFTEPYGSDLGQAWSECPRAEWSIEIAVRVGVPASLVEHAVGDLAKLSVTPDDAATRTADELAKRHGAGREDIEPLIEAVADLTTTLVESKPEVHAALHDDHLYADAQRDLADVVRRRISVNEVRVALEGLESHPYR